MSIAENVAAIRAQIIDAAMKAGRDPKSILLCAATKTNDAEAVREAIRAGVDCCGENRVQELTEKLSQNAYAGVPVHFIGHLQTNKVRQVVGKVDLIQSVDRIKLLQAIQQEAARQNVIQDVLLEINIGNEDSKSGFSTKEIWQILEVLSDFPNIRVKGLMAIPPICQNSVDSRKFFQEMCNLSVDIMAKKSDNVFMEILSMGMSGDFAEAICCGSTMIRVGTAIFGPRNYSRPHP
ncbi:MAG: YggS family pyridoxal phosphate-dependent enzyme [Ruminococcaceae bacterium]|nr:YggS family pyridoxal phosphate-dependent enzyme [Oscillospiraceae bacterium]